ncbi:hypothetical protein, partial [Streptomyces afghaniensis]
RDDRSGKQHRKHDREQDGDRVQDEAGKKAEKRAGKRAERQDGDAAADRGRSTRSLAPLRPAVSYPAKISWPRV